MIQQLSLVIHFVLAMKQKLKHIFKIAIITVFLPLKVMAQEETTENRTSIDISLDYLKLVSLFVDYETKLEGNLGFVFHRNFHLALEFGYAKLEPDDAYDNGRYKSEGIYGRAGLDYLLEINTKNYLLVGLRYGKSFFDDQVIAEFGSALFNPYVETRDNLEADWFEFVMGSETLIARNLFAGWKFRIKVLNNFDNPGMVNVYSIPGYGRTIDNTVPNINLYIKYLISF